MAAVTVAMEVVVAVMATMSAMTTRQHIVETTRRMELDKFIVEVHVNWNSV